MTIEPIDSVFLFGTGTVSGAWEPVLRALARTYGACLGKDDRRQDVATRWLALHGINKPASELDSLLANWVFGLRVNSARIVAALGPRGDPQVEQALQQGRAELLDLKETLASELSAAQDNGETRLREATVRLAAEHAGEGRSAILTTNWDLALERRFPSVPVRHLHGSIAKPSTMLLPGEVLNEPHRDNTDNEFLRDTYTDAMGHFAFAKRIYVVGLSLSLPDAALGAALNDGLQVWLRRAQGGERGTVVVVNREEDIGRIVAQVNVVIPYGWTVKRLPVG